MVKKPIPKKEVYEKVNSNEVGVLKRVTRRDGKGFKSKLEGEKSVNQH